MRPIDYDPNEEKDDTFDFNPRDYTPEELDLLEAALNVIIEKKKAKQQGSGFGDALE